MAARARWEVEAAKAKLPERYNQLEDEPCTMDIDALRVRPQKQDSEGSAHTATAPAEGSSDTQPS